jgi:hypothetical protein
MIAVLDRVAARTAARERMRKAVAVKLYIQATRRGPTTRYFRNLKIE